MKSAQKTSQKTDISYYISVDGSDTVCTCFYNKGYRWSDGTEIGTSL